MSESSRDGKEPHSNRYISVPKAMQCIPKQFTRNPVDLREFIWNVKAAHEVVEQLKYTLTFKICLRQSLSKITS